jgi:type IV pilus assembly protein PilX
MTRIRQLPARQKGAALAIGLILLLILTLLAVTGMNTSSTELVMAGNEQYRQRAFQAAEAGIERALPIVYKVPDNCLLKELDDLETKTGDTVKVTAQDKGDGPAPSGFGQDYATYHYEIVSKGASVRNANAQHIQGAFIVQRVSDELELGCDDSETF